ncbi:MAG: AIR synthase [Tissierellia bacterium]|nr:AIR synthase [Tissierellia bacterium]
MATGKLPNEVLDKLLKNNIKTNRKEVLVGAQVGMDTAQIDFGENVCVVSTDPITGASANIGSLAIDISVNDVSTSGADSIGVLVTILAPVGSTVDEIENIMKDASNRARDLNVQIIGGHTEITDAVNKFIVSTTVIGKINKKNIIKHKSVEFGDYIYMTKYMGLEGTAILASDKKNQLKGTLSDKELKEAQNLFNSISVKKDGMTAIKSEVHYMHDVTEGGIYGAIYEAYQGIHKGVEIIKEDIPVLDVTKKIAKYFDINPYRLISSGSMLIIARSNTNIENDFKLAGIKLTKIGEVKGDKPLIIENKEAKEIEPPTKDELYNAI